MTTDAYICKPAKDATPKGPASLKGKSSRACRVAGLDSGDGSDSWVLRDRCEADAVFGRGSWDDGPSRKGKQLLQVHLLLDHACAFDTMMGAKHVLGTPNWTRAT